MNRPRNRIDLSDLSLLPRLRLDPFAAVDIPDAGSAISCCGEEERAIFGIPHDMDGSWVFDLPYRLTRIVQPPKTDDAI